VNVHLPIFRLLVFCVPSCERKVRNGKTVMGEPRHTLFVRNLDKDVALSELKRALYCLFCQYGPIPDIQMMNKGGMKVLAFITFTDIAHATAARRDLNNMLFYGREMNIQFSHRPSFYTNPAERRSRDERNSRPQAKDKRPRNS